MFEIGNSLRETRRRQGLGLDEVAQATLIRNRYLDALERERFELLPEGFYRRSFLRRYADFLGLDGDLYVDEYELRYRPADLDGESEQRRPLVAPQLTARRLRPARTLVLAAVVALAALVALAGWEFVRTPAAHTPPARAPGSLTGLPAAAVPPRVSGAVLGPPPRVLVLLAARGDCWLEVRVGSLGGTTVYSGLLTQGESARFGLARALWINLGAPGNLDATLLGRDVTGELPTSPSEVVATAGGVRSAT